MLISSLVAINSNSAVAQAPTGPVVDPSERNIKLDQIIYDNHTFFADTTVVENAVDVCNSINTYSNLKANPHHKIVFDARKYAIESSGILSMKIFGKTGFNPNLKDFVCVSITSDTDTTGIKIVLKETAANSRIFRSVGGLLMSNIFNSNDYIYGPVIKVKVNDTVTASFSDTRNTKVKIVSPEILGLSGVGSSGVALAPSLLPSSTTRYVCDNDTPDRDNVCNEWETGGQLTITFNGQTYAGPACGDSGQDSCPAPNVKDLFVQIDALNGFAPDLQAITNVKTAFLSSMNTRTLSVYAPIYLHALMGNQNIPDFTSPPIPIVFPVDFTTIKDREFDNDAPNAVDQKSQVFHYVLFGYEIQGDTGSSGWGEIWGNDVLITLGNPNFNNGVIGPGSVTQQEGTLMHELGHNLNLLHGGNENYNCKPNYISTMSYIFQFPTIISDRVLDYSQSAIGKPGSSPMNLNEVDALDELVGLSQSTPAGKITAYGVPTSIAPSGYLIATAGTSPIQWDAADQALQSTARADINNIATVGGCTDTSHNMLKGYKDWTNSLKFRFQSSATFAAGMGNLNSPIEIHDTDIRDMLSARIIQINSTVQSLSPSAFVPHDANVSKATLNKFLVDAKDYTENYLYLKAFDVLAAMKSEVDNLVTNHTQNDLVQGIIDDVRISFRHNTSLPPPIELDSLTYQIDSSGVIAVKDNDANTDDGIIEMTNVKINSASDPNGISIGLTETAANSGIFAGGIGFISGASDDVNDKLHVMIGDSVVTSYGGYTISAQITPSV